MSHNDAELEVNFAHRLSTQMIAIGSAVDQVGIFELWPTSKKHLCNLLSEVADWSPDWTLDVMHAC